MNAAPLDLSQIAAPPIGGESPAAAPRLHAVPQAAPVQEPADPRAPVVMSPAAFGAVGAPAANVVQTQAGSVPVLGPVGGAAPASAAGLASIGSVGAPAADTSRAPAALDFGQLASISSGPKNGRTGGLIKLDGPLPSIGAVAPIERPQVYQPPALSLPQPPEVPGKWKPVYNKQHTKYVVPGVDGSPSQEYSRATRVGKAIEDQTTLVNWKARGAVLGFLHNPHLLEDLSIGGATHIDQLNWYARKTLEEAAEEALGAAGGHDAREFGTILHAYAEALVEGVVAWEQVPEVLQPYLASYFTKMRERGLSFAEGMVERVVYIPQTNSVGTLDFMCVDSAGTLMIGDIKTSSNIKFSWLSICCQLAQYANAALMLSRDGTCWEPMPDVNKVVAVVANIPYSASNPECHLYGVDLELGHELMDAAMWLSDLRATAIASDKPNFQPVEGQRLPSWKL